MTAVSDHSPHDVNTVSLAEARADLSRLASLAHYTGQITVLTRYGRPYAVIAPVDAVRLPGAEAAGSAATAEEIAADMVQAGKGSTATHEDVQAAVRAVRESDDA